MKHIFLIALIIGLGVLTHAQAGYEVSGDGKGKVLKGLISRDMLTSDPAFKWITDNQVGYTPDPVVVATLKARGEQVQFLVFSGTWCTDTHYLLPRFFALLDAASIPEKQLTLVGVDQDKSSTGHLSEDMHITSLPTFIILKDGNEVGRVIGYGQSEQWDQEIADIITHKF